MESVQNLETHDSAYSAFFTTAFNLAAGTAAVNSKRSIDTALIGPRRALPIKKEQ